MIPALLAMLGPKLLAGMGGGAAASGGLLGMGQLMGTAGGQALQQLAPTLSASMQQAAPTAPQGGLLNLQPSGASAQPVPEAALPPIPQAAKLGGRYQRQFKGLLS